MDKHSEVNRQAFNTLAKLDDVKPWQKAMSAQLIAALKARTGWLGLPSMPSPSQLQHQSTSNTHACPSRRNVKLLDYACGTGAVTRALYDYVSSARGLDVSEEMVQAYNAAFTQTAAATPAPTTAYLDSELQQQQPQPSPMNRPAHAAVGDFVGDVVVPPREVDGGDDPQASNKNTQDWTDFDLIVVGLGFHHFSDPGRAAKRLTERLKADGNATLCVIDFLPRWQEELLDAASSPKSTTASPRPQGQPGREGGPSIMSDARKTVKVDGFTNVDMQTLFTAAGLVDFAFDVLADPVRMEFADGGVRYRRMFLARGRKPKPLLTRAWDWLSGMQDTFGGQMEIRADARQRDFFTKDEGRRGMLG